MDVKKFFTAPVTLTKKLTRLFDKQEHCDVTFEVEGKSFGAHKVVLIAQDFRLYIQNGDEPVISVNGVDYETVHWIVRSLYTEDFDINKGNIFKLLSAANILGLSVLSAHCASYLNRHVSVENFVCMANVAADFKNIPLQQHFTTFFSLTYLKIISEVNFKCLTPEAIAVILASPPSVKIVTNQERELHLFVSFRRWSRAECKRSGINIASGEDIRNAFGESFRKLGVLNMGLQDIARLVIGKEILKKDEELKVLHFLAIPYCLHIEAIDEELPFERKPQSTSFHGVFAELQSKFCALCKLKLDGFYGAEMVHCTICDFDICIECYEIREHKHHRKFSCIKTVYGKAENSCNACGWPVDGSLFQYPLSFDATSPTFAAPASGFGAARPATTISPASGSWAVPAFDFGRQYKPAANTGVTKSNATSDQPGFAANLDGKKDLGINPDAPKFKCGSGSDAVTATSSDEQQKAESVETNFKSTNKSDAVCKNCNHPLNDKEERKLRSIKILLTNDFTEVETDVMDKLPLPEVSAMTEAVTLAYGYTSLKKNKKQKEYA